VVWRRAVLSCFALWVGCSSPSHGLVVDLRTDLRPGYDFVSVRTTLVEATDRAAEGRQASLAVAIDDDFTEGRRIAELDGLSTGPHLLRVELLDRAAAVVARRRVSTEVSGLRSVTLVITSDCFGVSCPGAMDPADATECAGGRCVSPECTEETPEACGVGGCATDAECAASAACATARCEGGACFQRPDDGRCPDGSYCDIVDGCSDPPPMDAGAPAVDAGGSDAGLADAGQCATPSCDDDDPCTIGRCVPSFGCLQDPLCARDEYCELGVCHSLPELVIETTDGAGCADLGRDHSGPGDFLFRRTVRGRAGAPFTQYNRHVGCVEAAMPAETDTLDAGGTYTDESNDMGSADCDSPILGRFSAYVEIDGMRSDPVEVTYFNSRCPGVSTCAEARTLCPPCRACDPATEYCHDGSECAPQPELVLQGGDGFFCADLGRAHVPPEWLWRRVVTGRPGATAQQFNAHVSCGEGPVAAEAISLDGAGRAELEATNADPSTDCSSPFLGRYDVYVEVDGERTATRELTYFNSSCPAVADCVSARTYCPD